jgi:hypothetical protein
MTKAELVALLSAYPDDRRVLIDSYEGGLEAPRVQDARAHFVGKRDWMGDWDACPFGEEVVILGYHEHAPGDDAECDIEAHLSETPEWMEKE